MRSLLPFVAVALLSVCYCAPAFAAKPVVLALNPQPEPPGVRLPPGPCHGANGKFMKCAAPAVGLREVGKEVSPGSWVVDPASIRGKRLSLAGMSGAAKTICIGNRDSDGVCKGIDLEL